jgi:hypothetical protein
MIAKQPPHGIISHGLDFQIPKFESARPGFQI